MPELTYKFRSSGSDGIIRDFDRVAAAQKRLARVSNDNRRAAGGGRAGKSAEERAEEQKLKAIERSQRMAEQLRIKGYKAESRALERAEAEKSRTLTKHEQYRRQVREASLRAEQRERAKADRQQEKQMARVRSIAGAGVGMMAGGAIALGGLGVAVSGAAVRNRMMADKQARMLASAGRAPGQVGIDPRVLLGDATKAALAVRGTKTSDVLAGMAKFQSLSGSLEGARTHAQTIATTSRATGAGEEDIASTAAMLSKTFNITDKGEMQTAMARMAAMGQNGAFELKDMAAEFGGMGAAGSRFGMRGAKGALQLTGLAQLARESSGSGAEAATGVEAMLRQLVVNEAKVKSLTGTNVFTDKTKTKGRDIEDVLVDVISGAKGSATKMQAIFGDQGSVGVAKLTSVYNDAAAAVGKNATEQEKQAAGIAAMRKVLDQTINAGGTWSDVLTAAASNTDTVEDTLTTAWEQLAAQIGDAVAPALKDLASNAPALGQAFGSITRATVGAVAGLNSLVKSLEAAGILKPQKVEEPAAAPRTELQRNRDRQKRLEEKRATQGTLTPDEEVTLANLKAKEGGLAEAAKTFEAGGRGTVAAAMTAVAGGFGGGAGAMGVLLGQAGLDPSHWSRDARNKAGDQERERMKGAQGVTPFWTQVFGMPDAVQDDINAESAGHSRYEHRGQKFSDTRSATDLFSGFANFTGGGKPQQVDMSKAEQQLAGAAEKLSAAADKIGSAKPSALGATPGFPPSRTTPGSPVPHSYE